MIGVTIQALNDQGRKAIMQHIEEKKKLPLFQRKQYQALFRETVISDKPQLFMLEILIRPKAVRLTVEFRDFKQRLEEVLVQNGAFPEDFIIREYIEDI